MDSKDGIDLFKSKEDLLRTAKMAVGHRVSFFNKNNRPLAKNNKGAVGQIIEEGLFNYSPNSSPEADFANLGIELKVTGIKAFSQSEFKVKERLVLNIINFMEEANVDFYHSSFWLKNKSLLLMFYLYEPERDDNDFLFLDATLHEFSEKDLEIIKDDWEIIHKKIVDGKAHTISEGDTKYLGAVSKGQGHGKDLREQPFSEIKAKQRAYSLKASYVNGIVKSLLNPEHLEALFTHEALKTSSLETLLLERLAPFFGKSETVLFKKFNINENSKSKFSNLISAILNLNGSINKTEEFTKAGITLKTVRVEENGKIEQHMSFPYFKFEDIVMETWEDSSTFELFSSSRFMFVIFRKINGVFYFDNVKFWNMPLEDIETFVKPVFEKTVDIISKGEIVKADDGRKYLTNFPGTSFNKVCHVRPHDIKGIRNSNCGLPLPVKDKFTGLTKYTKHCFWLDRNYILKIINS